ncbi:hemicentin-1-like [Physella acuta]|uniref:hemicentin-1-like n=1 Tax=Physella acuta TaxID=109671 RepID=UPI0027DB3537|nr:hemicentin-1-like [Physella acuta]
MTSPGPHHVTLTLVFLASLLCHVVPVDSQIHLDPDSHGASLAFVFDITGSMYDDLVQVIKGAAEILQDALTRREKPLQNYVLVPFHDPVVGPVLVTSDPEQFQAELRNLYVQGGGDCPEMSITAIKTALEASLPHSFIYVFTDARSKDFYLTEEVLALIQLRQSQVVFVLTGDCGDQHHNGYRAYEEIAATSSGQVFLLPKSQVNQVLSFVRVAVQARKVNLLSINEDDEKTQEVNLPLDTHLKEVTVSVSGVNPKIVLKDPEGNRMTLENGLTELLSLKNVSIVNIKDPVPGNWRLRYSSEGGHTVRVTGLSSADFVTGFSKYPTKDLTQTNLRPIQGIPTHVLINSTGIKFPSVLTDLELVDLRGNTIVKYPLSQDSNVESLYNVTSFVPPDQYFYVKVTGTDDFGYVMQRTTPTALSPLAAKAPSVFMPETTHGFFNTTTIVTCRVVSPISYTVQWWYQGKQQGYDLFFDDPANATLEIQRASSLVEGDYYCNATNSAGSQVTSTYLDISDPPPVIIPPQNVSVLPGEVATLYCNVISSVPYNLTWRRNGYPEKNILDPRIRHYNNDTLVIFNVGEQDEGSYSCMAVNEGGFTTEKVFLRLKVPPVADISPREQTYTTGATRNITCTATGFPEPTFQWLQNGDPFPTGGRVLIDGGFISFQNLKASDEGTYDCLASNSAGSSLMRTRLTYIEAPRIREFDKKLLVAVGDDARLYCLAEGIPLPNTTWYRADRMLQSVYNVDVTKAGQLLITNVLESDAGQYRCLVQNEAGSDSAELTLEVGSPPEIVQPPENTGIDIENNGSLPCHATGRPAPKISWRRGDGRPIDLGGRFRQQLSGSLDVFNVQQGDEGVFTCVAQNSFGTVESAAFVSVTGIVRPLIEYTNPYVKVIEGETAELECNILVGKPKPKLAWLRNGKLVRETDRLHMQDGNKIIITNAMEEDDGDYVCVASNIGGNETYNVNLDVLVPPKLQQEIDLDFQTNFSVTQGQGITLPCSVTADPPASITWFKSGSKIEFTDVRYLIRSDGALEIFGAEVSDAGQFRCVASNSAGKVDKDVTLFVEVPPAIAGEYEETIEVIVGESVLLPCEVTGSPQPSVSWNQNFLPLVPDSPRMEVQASGLYISETQSSDKAFYECVATNVAGERSKIFSLAVYIPPTIEAGPTDVTVLYGQSAVLECESSGDPQPAVLWKKDGVVLDADDVDRGYFMSPRGSLTISSAELTDSGDYTCTATNPAGVISRGIYLTVHGAPEIQGLYTEYNEVVEKNPVILFCPAVGTPKPTITWYKDNVPISHEEAGTTQLEDGSLEIDNTKAGDSGKYECVAENVAGIANRNFELKILVPPKLTGAGGSGLPERSKATVQRNVTLLCPVSDETDPPPVITWFKDNKELKIDERMTLANHGKLLTIYQVAIGDEARYHCMATNVAGTVKKDFNLEVDVPPSVDESGLSPANQSVISGQTLYINCPIQGKPPPQVRWLKDGEPLSLDASIRLHGEGRRLELFNAQVTDKGRYVCIGENIAGQTTRDFVVDVFIPPKVDRAGFPEDLEVIEGSSVKLTCPASGIPLPKITWFKQEQHIKANSSKLTLLDSGWTLEINDANVTDASRYYCRAENVAGQSEKVFDIDVLLRPTINRDNIDLKPEASVNNSIAFNCLATGNPSPEILWYRNGVLLDASIHPRHEIVAGGRQLRLYSVQVKDTGRYTCSAKNRAGKEEIDFDFFVTVPPRINRQGINFHQRVLVNSSITLPCPVSGIPPPTINWLKDNQPVEEKAGIVERRSNGTELVILQASLVDTGRYRCEVFNQAGEDSISLNLNVQVPANIPVDGINPEIVVVENETITLECPAQGVPEPSIVWYLNSQPLDPDSLPHLSSTDSGKRLVISNSHVSDAGIYLCIASNQAGDAELTYNVEVWVPPVIDHTALDTKPRFLLGHTISINCPVTGIPFPTITWLKDGQEIPDQPRIQIVSNGLQLRIAPSEEGDTGMYSCVAMSPAGVDKADFDLAVQLPPSIDESNVVYDRKVNVDRKVQLECPVHGIPIPTVEWMVNGAPAQNLDHLVFLNNNRILEIDKVSVGDTASYTCIATNEAGQIERIFNLEVLIPPSIERKSVEKSLSVVQNSTVRLHCPATGVPEPDILWMKDKQPILDFPYIDMRVLNDGQTLELSNAQLEDAGNYSCRAINPAGVDDMDLTLQVFIPPLIGKPTPDRLHVHQGQSISMRCAVIGNPEPTILWFKDGAVILEEENGRKQILDHSMTLQIVDVQPLDRARYTCHAENQAGFAEKYFDLEVYEPARINGSGKRVEMPVILDQEVVLNCPAEGVPTPSITWYRKNVLIPAYGMANIRIQETGKQLVILSAQLLDFGDYSCYARNDAGDDRLQFIVSIMVPPEIEEGQTEVAESVNSRAILPCETSGQPPPTVTWTKNDQPFPATGLRHRVLPSGSLEFMIVRLEDDGVYTCNASNAAGSAHRSVQLYVRIPAKIVSRGQPTVRASEGEAVILSCQVEGLPTPNLQWLKNRILLSPDRRITLMSNGSLYISVLDRKDAGVYTCLAENNAGSDAKDIRLRVQEPPELLVGQTEFTVLQNRTIVLPCQANGRPKPKITWEKDGQDITLSTSHRRGSGRVHYITLQNGNLAIPHSRAEDVGTYTCTAENSAGRRSQTLKLYVHVPPMIESTNRQFTVSVGSNVALPCKTTGIPTPTINWTKDRRRIDFRSPKFKVEQDGRLFISNISAEDTGDYVCTAENSAGTDSQSRLVRVQVPPVFINVPRDRELTVNSRFQMSCSAKGSPTPSITWKLNGKTLAAPASVNGASTITVRNAMKEDAGEYTCIAANPAGQLITASARVIIKVPPRVIVPPLDWAVKIAEKVVLDCSVGGDPAPEIVWTKNSRPVELGDRIQQLENGSLIIYDATASDAGKYKCIAVNDAGTSEAQSVVTVKSEPKFKIEPSNAVVEVGETTLFDCTAEGVPAPSMFWWKEKVAIVTGGRISVLANNTLRIVATQQSDGGLYRCFASNPLGKTFVETYLNVVVHGEYSSWGPWGHCSASCGRGEHSRVRSCDNPRPENGGRNCVGPSVEVSSCMIEACPVHGNWGAWNLWSECSLTCGGGHRRRIRACNNPAPSGSGQPCMGSAEETENCNSQQCPVDGKFSDWSDWSVCSVTCGQGTQVRSRNCIQPSNGGRRCWGDTNEVMECSLPPCSKIPLRGKGYVLGIINNVDIADTTITAEIIPRESGSTRVQASITAIPPDAVDSMQHLISLLTPVYWTTAQEIKGAANGYTLTEGKFSREVQVEFATGEILKMSHYANGVDSDGILQFDIIIRGEVPDLGTVSKVHLAPYQEEYIQTGPGTIYAHSSRLFSADGFTLPYAWNHTITYESSGQMPYLVQVLSTKDLQVEAIPEEQTINFVLDASIAPGNPSNRCPSGFQHDPHESFCRDDDECAVSSPCSHSCHNTPGSYSCSCPPGFLLTSDAHTCQDINECAQASTDCGPSMECINTPGSFRCVNACSGGFMPEENGDRCIDINECDSVPEVCEHTCENLVGGHRCSCLPGYRLAEKGRCIDVDECEEGSSACSHRCTNTQGSFVCSCPAGYKLLNGRVCRDINECVEVRNSCKPQEECVNSDGSFSCIRSCPAGYRRTASGQCQDIDECRSQNSCYYNQRCVNTEGSYRCECPEGFKFRGIGLSCLDVDECVENPRVCSYICRNTWGSYECLCPPGQTQLADRKSCAGLEFLEPGRVLPAEQSNIDDLISEQKIHTPREGFRHSGTLALTSETRDRNRKLIRRRPVVKESGPVLISEDRRNEGFSALERRDQDTEYYRAQPKLTTPSNEKYYLPTPRPKRWKSRFRRSLDLCQEGYTQDPLNKSQCIDLDECAEGRSLCQHNCTNTRGSYKCSCPQGYMLDSDGYSCKDVNECVRDEIDCGPEKMCFNQRGSYTCIDIPCPPDYARDPTTKFCVLECVNPTIPCPPGAKYADIIEFKTLALPGGSQARQDLIRLTAYNQHDQYLPQTMFTILKNDPHLEFSIKTDEGRGIVYTMEPLQDSSTYRIMVRAKSYDNYRRHIQYQTTFIIHISVSAYPY